MLVQLFDELADLRDIVIVALSGRISSYAAVRGWVDDPTQRHREPGSEATSHGLVRVLPGRIALVGAVSQFTLAEFWTVIISGRFH